MSTFSVFDHLFDPVIITSSAGDIEYFNHQTSAFFKLSPRILKQKKKLAELCSSPDLNLEDWLREARERNEVEVSPEINLLLPHDPDAQYHIILKNIPAELEQKKHFILVFHDKTVETALHSKYRVQLDELKKAHTQIIQADKLATLGEITASISHEINNPLTIAAGNSEIIQSYLEMPKPEAKIPQLQAANKTVLESLDRVSQIIRNMKDFLHKNEDTKEYCDLEALLDASIEWVQPTARKAQITIRKEIQAQRTVALANRIKLEQVLINLIKNSIDALSEADIQNKEIVIGLSKSKDDRQTILDIKDNGPGLSEEIKKNLFKPFMSTKLANNGTGLGLSICSKIIEGHKGNLEHIEHKSGCHFQVRLPLIEVYSYTRNDKSLSGARKQKRVLVLDNEVQILNVLSSFIQDEGLVFIGSSDPQNALDFISKANVDLIITDFSMPLMTGGQFARAARAKGYQGPIFYMSNSGAIEQYHADKKELEISGLILKPFNRDEIIKTIQTALGPQKLEVK